MFRFLLVVTVLLTVSASVMAQHRLRKEGEMCGGFAGFQCAGNLMCEPKPGMCQGADISGTCVPSGVLCTADVRPVCGCDGKTYNNDCERRSSRVAKNYDGACKQ